MSRLENITGSSQIPDRQKKKQGSFLTGWRSKTKEKDKTDLLNGDKEKDTFEMKQEVPEKKVKKKKRGWLKKIFGKGKKGQNQE